MSRSRVRSRALAVVVMMLGLGAAACVPAAETPPPPPAPPAPPPAPPAPPPLPDPPPALDALPASSPTFTETVVLDQLQSQIWDLAFTPDGHMLLSLREQGIAVFREGDTAFDTPDGPAPTVIHVLDDLWVDGPESGSLGLDVHPDFATNRYLYVCYTSQSPEARVRLYRFTVNADYTALTDPYELIPGGIGTGQPPYGFHHGCRVKFQPGSSPPALFVTVGDGGIGTAPQDLSNAAGKVLRLTDLGAPYPGNPFGGDAIQSRIFTYGHRNPQGIAFAEDGTIYSAEHGPSVDDEVNKLSPGRNAGWDPVPGYNQDVPMTDLGRFPDALVPVWRSGAPTLAPSGITVLRHDSWGSWKGALVVAFLKARRLMVMFRDGNGAVTGTWTEAQIGDDSAAAYGSPPRLRTVVEDGSGNLWIPTDHPYDNPIVPASWHDPRPGQLIELTPSPPP